MNKFRFTIKILAIAIFMLAFASLTQAQATRTWVSGVGDDVNPCSRTAPCKTYAGAISKTAVNGEISTLDPGGFGAVTITKSITIEGTQGQGYGSILHSSTIGVSIAFDSFSGEALTQRSVRLRNLNINGSGGSGGSAVSGTRGIRITGGANSNNSEVTVENCVIDGSFLSPGRGIEDLRNGTPMKLNVSDTVIRNMLGAGITAAPASPGTLNVSLNNVQIFNCGFGIAFSNNSRVTAFRSSFSGNGTGVFSDAAGGTSAEINVDQCIVSNNTTAGFSASTAGTTIRVSNTTAVNNTTLATVAGGGAVSSYGNNQTAGVAFPSTPTMQS